jgi:hypothetical protein
MSNDRVHEPTDDTLLPILRYHPELRWAARHVKRFGCTPEECRRRPVQALLRIKAGELSDG